MLESAIQSLKANDQTLESLDLRFNNTGDEGAKALAEALEKNTTLQSLDLWGNNIRDEGAKALAEALLQNKTLQFLGLWGNNIGVNGIVALAEVLEKNKTLHSLSLSGSNIEDPRVAKLAEALKHSETLKWLILTNNNLRDHAAAKLAEALKQNKTLLSLNLAENNIGAEGAKALAEALKENKTLLLLSLWGNNIGAEGEKALAEALKDNYAMTDINGYNLQEIKQLVNRNKEFAKKIANVVKAKIEGRDEAKSIFKTPNASSQAFYKEVYELGISFADIQKLNKGGYAALKSALIKECSITSEQCDKLISSLKAVEHFIYLRDVVLNGYKFPIAAFKAVTTKNAFLSNSGLALFSAGNDYNALRFACNSALGESCYERIAAEPNIQMPVLTNRMLSSSTQTQAQK